MNLLNEEAFSVFSWEKIATNLAELRLVIFPSLPQSLSIALIIGGSISFCSKTTINVKT